MAILPATFAMVDDPVNGRFSIDPSASFSSPLQLVDSEAAIIIPQNDEDISVAAGATLVLEFTSVNPGTWYIAAGPDSAVLTQSTDRKSCTLTWAIPAGMVGHSRFMGVGCKVGNVVVESTRRVYVGVNNIIKFGSGVGYDYSDPVLARAAMGSGDVLVIQDGIYTGEVARALQMYKVPGINSLVPNGEHTVNLSASHVPNSVVMQKWTTVMSETPFGVIVDLENNNQFAHQSFFYVSGNLDTTKIEDWSRWQSNLQSPNDEIRGIAVKGIVAKNCADSAYYVQNADHFHFEYVGATNCCFPNSGNNASESSAYSYFYASRCLLEYFFSDSSGRYDPSKFKTDQVVHRRFLGRRGYANPLATGQSYHQPFAGSSSYSSRKARESDAVLFDFDSDYIEYSSAEAGCAFFDPSTGDEDYPQDCRRNQCFAIRMDMGFIQGTANAITDDAQQRSMRYDSMIGYGLHNKLTGLFISNGPLFGRDMRLFRSRPLGGGGDDSSFFGVYLTNQEWENVLLCDLGWDEVTQDTLDQGPLATSKLEDYLNILSGYLHNFKGSPLLSITSNDQSTINLDQALNPYENGVMYIERIEEGSVLAGLGYPTKSRLIADGEAGTFFDDPNFEDYDTGVFWLQRMFIEKIAPIFQGYSYSGPQGNLSGDRGLMQSGSNFIEEHQALLGNTPYPVYLSVSGGGGKISVSIAHLSEKFKANITAIKIKVDDQVEATLNAATTAAEFSNLIAGHRYNVRAAYVDSVTGESGLSQNYSVAA